MEIVSEGAISSLAVHRGARVSIVIPAHNEAENLPHLLPRLPTWVHEVILVNDHSTDETEAVARSLLPDIRLVHTQSGRGKGAALQTGFAAAQGEIIVMMDADGSSDPDELPRFVEALLAGAYLAKGSRFLTGGGSSDITPLRRLGSQILIGVANRLFGVRFTDMFCGLNAFWKDCLSYFEVDCPGFEIEALLHLRICKANLLIVEVPSFEHARLHGVSKFRTFRDGWRVFKMIVRERLNGRSVIRPVTRPHPAPIEEGAWTGLAVPGHLGAAQ
ncbi:MAG TPA: glycosyltransferase family 2 protein [Ktedonobacteraceae bacterium]|jgi:glycosyltransferase involved in cell wall biosynthesis|nr:glycosyltransferase family 2 protein [Ktedonobacteraceae bacterium]